MDEFKVAAKAAMDKSKPTLCKCPKCPGTIHLRYNDFTDGVQAMCDTCGRFWFEGVEESDE